MNVTRWRRIRPGDECSERAFSMLGWIIDNAQKLGKRKAMKMMMPFLPGNLGFGWEHPNKSTQRPEGESSYNLLTRQ